MVRLKVNSTVAATLKTDMFQFQNGAIKSVNEMVFICTHSKFQFQNGAIKSSYIGERLLSLLRVSIPKWCD